MDEYYALCPKVYLMKQNLGQTNYDMDEMYNKETVEDLACPMDANAYRYLSIRFTEETDLKEIALFLHGETEVDMKIYAFVLAAIPVSKKQSSKGNYDMKFIHEDGRYFDFDLDEEDDSKGVVHYFDGIRTVDYNFTTSGDDANAVNDESHRVFAFKLVESGIRVTTYRPEDAMIDPDVPIEFYEEEIDGEPALTNAIATINIGLSPASWSSFRVAEWNNNGVSEKQVHIPTNHYLVFRFDNNCPGATAKGLAQCEVKATNVLIRK